MAAIPLLRRAKRASDERHLQLVQPPPMRHTAAYVVGLGVLVVITVFATVAVNAMGAGDAVKVHKLQAEVDEAEERYAALVATVAHLEDPARIEAVAVDRLGMVPAEDAGFLVLDRPLSRDEVRHERPEVAAGEQADPLKPVLSVER